MIGVIALDRTAMRWLGHFCVAMCLICAANVVSTFVPGGPLVGVGGMWLAHLLVVVAGGVAPLWYEVAATPRRPRRRELFSVIPRTTLVVGVCAVATFASFAGYGLISTPSSDPVTPGTASAVVGTLAGFSALITYGTSRLSDKYRAIAGPAYGDVGQPNMGLDREPGQSYGHSAS